MPNGRFYLAGLAAALTLSACAREQAPPEPAPPVPSQPPSGGAAESASTFVETAGSVDLFVIRASEMARSKASSAAVRNLAATMLAGHRGTSGQLSLAGRRLNLLPSANLQPTHRRMLDELTLSVGFDRLYLQHMASIHEQSVALHSAFARQGESPTLRPVAASAEKVERTHRDLVRRAR